MRKMVSLLAVAVLAPVSLVACGDDDDTAAESPLAVDEDFAEFCAVSEEIDAGDDFPTDEQMERWRDASPEEVREDTELVVATIEEHGFMASFQQEGFAEAFQRVEDFEDEHCPHRTDREDRPEPEAQEPDEDATIVTVIATEYAFEIQDPVPAGKVAFVMENEGEEPHHIDLVRFKDEFSEDEIRQALEDGSDDLFGMIDDDAELADQTTSTDAEAGEQAVLNAELGPGLYGLACFVSAPDGAPHFFHGMWAIFTIE